MALIICPECNSALSEFAEKCPTCGCDRETIQKLIENKRQQELNLQKRMEFGQTITVIAFGGCAPLATILISLLISVMTATCLLLALMSAPTSMAFVPLCGWIFLIFNY